MPFSPLVERAAELAAEWHDGTYRKSRWRDVPFAVPADEPPVRVPVVAHLAVVATTVQRAGWEEVVVAAAFLHDVLEDRNRYGDRMTPQRLAELVGPEVAALVVDVTEPRAEGGGALPWRVRKEAYLARLRQAPDAAVAVALADKLHNLWTVRQGLEAGRDPFTPAPGRRPLSAGPEAQRWFFRAVLELAAGRPDPRLEPLREALRAELERFERALEAPGHAVTSASADGPP